MIKISKMKDYAFVSLSMIARRSGYSMSASELSKETVLALYSVQKLLKLMISKSDFIRSNLGKLNSNISTGNSSYISVVEIIETLDSTITLTSFFDKSKSSCVTNNISYLVGKWNKINVIIRKFLNDISLKDLVGYENTFFINDKKNILIDRIN